MNKRGITDILYFTVLVVGLAIFILVLGAVVGDVSEKLKDSTLNESEEALSALEYSDKLTAQFDYVFLFVFMALLLGVLISSALIHVHQIFVPIFIILLIIAVVVGVIMNNVYAEFTEATYFSSAAAESNFANAIIENYVLVIIGVGILSMILIFGKTRSGDQRL